MATTCLDADRSPFDRPVCSSSNASSACGERPRSISNCQSSFHASGLSGAAWAACSKASAAAQPRAAGRVAAGLDARNKGRHTREVPVCNRQFIDLFAFDGNRPLGASLPSPATGVALTYETLVVNSASVYHPPNRPESTNASDRAAHVGRVLAPAVRIRLCLTLNNSWRICARI